MDKMTCVTKMQPGLAFQPVTVLTRPRSGWMHVKIAGQKEHLKLRSTNCVPSFSQCGALKKLAQQELNVTHTLATQHRPQREKAAFATAKTSVTAPIRNAATVGVPLKKTFRRSISAFEVANFPASALNAANPMSAKAACMANAKRETEKDAGACEEKEAYRTMQMQKEAAAWNRDVAARRMTVAAAAVAAAAAAAVAAAAAAVVAKEKEAATEMKMMQKQKAAVVAAAAKRRTAQAAVVAAAAKQKAAVVAAAAKQRTAQAAVVAAAAKQKAAVVTAAAKRRTAQAQAQAEAEAKAEARQKATTAAKKSSGVEEAAAAATQQQQQQQPQQHTKKRRRKSSNVKWSGEEDALLARLFHSPDGQKLRISGEYRGKTRFRGWAWLMGEFNKATGAFVEHTIRSAGAVS